jgi:hypothetical protein
MCDMVLIFIFTCSNGTMKSSNEISLLVSPSLSIPTTLQDFQPASAPSLSSSSSLSQPTISPSVLENLGEAHIPGKLYGQSAAETLLGTLETGGASARLSMDLKASPRQEAAFVKLRERLDNGSLVSSLILTLF